MKYSKVNKRLIIGIVLTSLVVLAVVTGLFWLPYDVNAMDPSSVCQAPSWKHLFGTDNFGRDIYSRVMNGASVTFLIAIATVTIGALIGTLVGAFTGYFGGPVDEVLMRLNDCLASFPSILLALVVVSVLDVGTYNICIALGLVFIPSFARIMRAAYMEAKEKDYVLSAKLMGASDIRAMFIHIFPNTLDTLIPAVLVGLNNAVLAEAGLSYLGLGVQPPDPSLGRMLAEGQAYLMRAPWYVCFTCLVMVLAIVGISLICENKGVSGVAIGSVKKKIEKQRLTEQQKGLICEADGAERTEAADEVSGDDQPEAVALKVDDLSVSFLDDDGMCETIKGISFELDRGEIVGIVGESGSGKSLTALAVMDILPNKAVITKGTIRIGDGMRSARELRGHEIAMIFQEPMTSLNPVETVGEQIDEVLDIHMSELSAGEQRELVIAAMHDAGLDDAADIYNKYPHELSGGMRQRIMIAMALVAEAEVIIADEPTTALDEAVAGDIIETFRLINKKRGTSILFISHDLKLVESFCDRALIMEQGRIVEQVGIVNGRFAEPVTAYGRCLLEAAYSTTEFKSAGSGEKVLELKSFSTYYPVRDSIIGRTKYKEINHEISMSVEQGECFGLVGSSGCGKSTLVKGIAGLLKKTTGECRLYLKTPGMVFQDPYNSLNPAWTVRRILEEPLRIKRKHAGRTGQTDDGRDILEMLEAVGLTGSILDRRTSELSGGQRQRVAIAQNLLFAPGLIILDEPLSAVDVTLREKLLQTIFDLKKRYGLTYILISHDRTLVERCCDHMMKL